THTYYVTKDEVLVHNCGGGEQAANTAEAVGPNPQATAPETVASPEQALAAGSAEHKATRWSEYQARGGEWEYERWSNVYESNMKQATKANAAMDAYQKELGWGQREVTVEVEGVERRLDIGDESTMRGVEHKTGYQTATQANRWEVLRDQILREKYKW